MGDAEHHDTSFVSDPVGAGKRLVARVDRYQREHAWAAFPLAVVKKFGDDQSGSLAVLIAYYTFFSIFPLLLALVAVLGFFLSGDPQLQARIVDSALANFPVIGDQIRDNIGSLDGSGVALVLGVLGALWAGLGAVEAAEQAFNSVWDVPRKERPSFLSRKLRGAAMILVIGLGLIATTVLAGAGTSTLSAFGLAARLLGIATSLLVNIALFLLGYKVLTKVDVGWTAFVPGAVVAGIAWLVLQSLGGWLVTSRLQGATQTYGTFAVVIALLSWLYIQAQITLLAAEINVVRHERLWPRSLTGADLTDADLRSQVREAEESEVLASSEVEVVRLDDVAGPALQPPDRSRQGAQPPERSRG